MSRILLCVAAALMMLTGCKKNENIQPLSKTQDEAFKYLPAESQVVFYFNLAELRNTDFWDSYFKPALLNSDHNSWIKGFEDQTGTGLNNGISQIFIASGTNFNTTGIAVLNKNVKQIKNRFENNDSYLKEMIKGRTVYLLKGKYPVRFYFVNDSLLLASNDKNYLESVIKGKNNSIKNNSKLFQLIKNLREKNQYWIAADKGKYLFNYVKTFLDFDRNIPADNILNSLKGATLSVRFGREINIESNLNCKSTKKAYLLSTAIKGALAMDLLSGGDYSISRILEKTEVETENSQVNLQLELKGKEINTLKDFASKRNLESKL